VILRQTPGEMRKSLNEVSITLFRLVLIKRGKPFDRIDENLFRDRSSEAFAEPHLPVKRLQIAMTNGINFRRFEGLNVFLRFGLAQKTRIIANKFVVSSPKSNRSLPQLFKFLLV
jgi:hypothetical protein